MKYFAFIAGIIGFSLLIVGLFSSTEHALAHVKITTDVNWSDDVMPIIEEKCMSCHHPGGLAPDYIDLTEYGTSTEPKARGWAEAIKDEIISNRMPPWKPDGRFSNFETNKLLTQDEKDIIIAWADGGGPQGPTRNIPMPEQFNAPFWPFGDPDMVFEAETPFTLKADEEFASVTYTFPVELEEDTYITGYEFLIENPKNVHSIHAWLNDPEGVEIPPIEMEVQLEYDPLAEENKEIRLREMPKGTHILGQWLPGDEPVLFPDESGKYFRVGSTITMTIQYIRPEFAETVEDVEDRSKLGLFVAQKDEEIDLLVESIQIVGDAFAVAADDRNFRTTNSYTVQEAMSLIGLAPQLGPVSKNLEVSITYPDQRKSTLLWIPAFKQRWEASYRFAEPINTPVGSVIDVVAHFDNSDDNWDNPNSPPIELASGTAHTEVKLTTTLDYVLTDHLKVETVFVPRKRPAGEQGGGMSIAIRSDFIEGAGTDEDVKPNPDLTNAIANAAEAELDIYWCPMRGNPCELRDYHEEGTCDDCFMDLRPKEFFFEGKEPAPETYAWALTKAGRGYTYWCPNRGRDDHEQTDYYVPGRCEVCSEELLHQAQFKEVHTFTCMTPDCENYQDLYYGPGLCTSCGQPVTGMGHMDHTPVHGGWQFFMSNNLYHHLEGTMFEEGLFQLYLYDDWKNPLDARNFKAALFIEHENVETGEVTETEYELVSAKEGNTWLTAELPKELPITFYTQIWLAGEEKRYDFEFEELTIPPAADAPSADIILHAHNCLPMVPPATVEGIVSEIFKMNDMILARIDAKDWLKLHCPAVDTKTLADALSDAVTGLSPRQRGTMKKIIAKVNRSYLKLDQAGDAGDAPRVTRAYREYGEAIELIRGLYPDVAQ